MTEAKAFVAEQDTPVSTPRAYTIGFGLSLGLTLLTYSAVVHHWLHGNALIAIIVTLAIIQLFVQLVFFLHLGRESKPRWNLTVFAFMLTVLLIVVLGSIWIMNNLNYHHDQFKTPAQTDQYIIHDEGIKVH